MLLNENLFKDVICEENNTSQITMQDKFNYLKEYPIYNNKYMRPCRYYDLGLTPKQEAEFFKFLEDGGLATFWDANEELSDGIYQEGRMGGQLVLNKDIVDPTDFQDFNSYQDLLDYAIDEYRYNGEVEDWEVQEATEDVESKINSAYEQLVSFDNRVDELINNLKVTLDSRLQHSEDDINEALEEDYTEEIYKDFAEFLDMLKYNGARYRGAPIPNAIKGCLNQINIPDNMRAKYYEINDISTPHYFKGVFNFTTQEPFSEEDSKRFESEVKEAFNGLIERTGFDKPFEILLHVKARDGINYGNLISNLVFNEIQENSVNESFKKVYSGQHTELDQFLDRLNKYMNDFMDVLQIERPSDPFTIQDVAEATVGIDSFNEDADQLMQLFSDDTIKNQELIRLIQENRWLKNNVEYAQEIACIILDENKLKEESYKVIDKNGNKVPQGGKFTSKKEAEMFAAQYGEKDLKVVKESFEKKEFTIHYNKKGFEYGGYGAVRVKASNEEEAKKKFLDKKVDKDIEITSVRPTENEDIKKGIKLLEDNEIVKELFEEDKKYKSIVIRDNASQAEWYFELNNNFELDGATIKEHAEYCIEGGNGFNIEKFQDLIDCKEVTFNKSIEDLTQPTYLFNVKHLRESFEDEHLGRTSEEVALDSVKPGPEAGLAAEITKLIKDEWDAIQAYNDAIVSFETEGKSDLIDILRDIVNEENLHVGQLESLLSQLDPNTQAINQGEIEANQQLTSTQVSESLNNKDLNTYSKALIDAYTDEEIQKLLQEIRTYGRQDLYNKAMELKQSSSDTSWKYVAKEISNIIYNEVNEDPEEGMHY